MHSAEAEATAQRYRWLFLVNAVIVAVAALPLLFAFPRVFASLGIPSLDNGFFVQLAAGWLATEAYASYLVWRRPLGNNDLILVIISMKWILIPIVVINLANGDLPATAFLIAAGIDLVLSIAFFLYLRALSSEAS